MLALGYLVFLISIPQNSDLYTFITFITFPLNFSDFVQNVTDDLFHTTCNFLVF